MQRRDFKGNVYRHLLAIAIEANGGYSSDYHDRYTLSWNVSIHGYIKDFDQLFEKALVSDYGPGRDAVLDAELLAKVREEWDDESNQNQMWYWIVESMRESVSDTDSYRTLSPEVAARYGLPGSHAKLHSGKRYDRKYKYREGAWSHTLYFDVKWEFVGRQGKHLVLTEFEGHRLNMRSDDLADAIREGESSYSNEWCQKLLAFIHECDLCFAPKAVKNEFEYQVLYHLASKLEEMAQETKALQKESTERQFWAERDVSTKTTGSRP